MKQQVGELNPPYRLMLTPGPSSVDPRVYRALATPLMLLALFAMGVHSTFFGPIKYAILPQHLTKDEVLGGTGLVEAGTYIGILGGTLLGGVLVVPDVICNAGGVTVSYFEWVQDFSSFFWSEDEINVRLDKIMVDALKKIWDTADRHKISLRTATFAVACDDWSAKSVSPPSGGMTWAYSIVALAGTLPYWRRLCSSFDTSPIVARQSTCTLRISPECMRSCA